jgi:hypothetical protein
LCLKVISHARPDEDIKYNAHKTAGSYLFIKACKTMSGIDRLPILSCIAIIPIIRRFSGGYSGDP